MRFIRLALSSLLCFLLASCAGEPPPPPSPLAVHTGNYEAAALIRRGGFLAEAVISQRSPDSYVVRFSSPDSLAGMAFDFRQGLATVGYGELELSFDGASIPAGAVPALLRSALAAAMRQDAVAVTESDSGTELRGETDAGGFTLRLDPESGQPMKLLFPEEELEIAFTRFTFFD